MVFTESCTIHSIWYSQLSPSLAENHRPSQNNSNATTHEVLIDALTGAIQPSESVAETSCEQVGGNIAWLADVEPH